DFLAGSTHLPLSIPSLPPLDLELLEVEAGFSLTMGPARPNIPHLIGKKSKLESSVSVGTESPRGRVRPSRGPWARVLHLHKRATDQVSKDRPETRTHLPASDFLVSEGSVIQRVRHKRLSWAGFFVFCYLMLHSFRHKEKNNLKKENAIYFCDPIFIALLAVIPLGWGEVDVGMVVLCWMMKLRLELGVEINRLDFTFSHHSMCVICWHLALLVVVDCLGSPLVLPSCVEWIHSNLLNQYSDDIHGSS
uniref:Uncharacterized protein n=1 Tax=Sus scrofa TaxID=9823 RepID=A0A8D1L122_PIG